MRTLHTFLLAAIGMTGCSNSDSSSEFIRGEGSSGEFILAQIIKRGGRPIATNALPEIAGTWSFFEDDNGAVVHLERGAFPSIEAFVSLSLGPPAHVPSETRDGGKLGWYAARELGAAVQFGYDNEKSYLNIIRPISREEMIDGLEKIVDGQ